ncbi:uncharacterized protein GGS22DRAFT_196602 [Annulohypoxylon maeteangense]|uniref:uncharacterized protein n=1 Tax=Annulohypoxylon maeteangense TaxID=1927788 RepID=UPI002007E7CF|nr:uncharacterized protein GGS22DRAFT_196602 [Annulohypoxylon maeteangense]KAI0888726.1 hypothetical protein GGS22DRAFT_196602 [Annulohypoxylon maeteangense]
MKSDLKPDIFQELQARHFTCLRDFNPVEIQVIEVGGFETGNPTVQSFVVKPEELEGWLSRIDENQGQSKRKLRIMLGYLGKGTKYDYMMPTGDNIATGVSEFALPFSQKHFGMVSEKFRLPKITSILLTKGARAIRGHFQVERISSKEENTAYGMAMSSFSSLLIGIKLAISMSYSPCTGVTNAILLGSGSSNDFSWLQRDLEHLVSLADNPFLVITLICQRLMEAIYASIDDNFDRLHQVEIGSGQTGIMMFGENGMPMPRGNCEDPNLSTTVLGVAQQALAIEAYIQGHQLTVRSAKSELLEFPWQRFSPINHDRILEQNELIIKQLDFTNRTLDFALLRVGHLKQRANVQATAITNLLAQRNNEINRKLAESSTSIARDTRRDSLAMKSIAVLTMIFLPGTFTATYFSTPAMTALQPSQNLYWIVTVPLTVIVVLVWLLAFQFWVAAKFQSIRRGNMI